MIIEKMSLTVRVQFPRESNRLESCLLVVGRRFFFLFVKGLVRLEGL